MGGKGEVSSVPWKEGRCCTIGIPSYCKGLSLSRGKASNLMFKLFLTAIRTQCPDDNHNEPSMYDFL